MLPLQKHRTRTYFDHGGAHYPETIMFWGAEVSAHYGWTPFEQRKRPEAECSYVTYYWTGGLELSLILLQLFRVHAGRAFRAANSSFPSPTRLRNSTTCITRATRTGGCASSRRSRWRPGTTRPIRCRTSPACATCCPSS